MFGPFAAEEFDILLLCAYLPSRLEFWAFETRLLPESVRKCGRRTKSITVTFPKGRRDIRLELGSFSGGLGGVVAAQGVVETGERGAGQGRAWSKRGNKGSFSGGLGT